MEILEIKLESTGCADKFRTDDYTATKHINNIDLSLTTCQSSILNKKWIYILNYNKQMQSLFVPVNKVNRTLPDDKFFIMNNDEMIRFYAKDSANYDAQTYYSGEKEACQI